jgi:hypothetical protein
VGLPQFPLPVEGIVQALPPEDFVQALPVEGIVQALPVEGCSLQIEGIVQTVPVVRLCAEVNIASFFSHDHLL